MIADSRLLTYEWWAMMRGLRILAMDAHPDFIVSNLLEAAQKIIPVLNPESVESTLGHASSSLLGY